MLTAWSRKLCNTSTASALATRLLPNALAVTSCDIRGCGEAALSRRKPLRYMGLGYKNPDGATHALTGFCRYNKYPENRRIDLAPRRRFSYNGFCDFAGVPVRRLLNSGGPMIR